MLFLSILCMVAPLVVCQIHVMNGNTVWSDFYNNFNFIATCILSYILTSTTYSFFNKEKERLVLPFKVYMRWLLLAILVINVFTVYDVEQYFTLSLVSDYSTIGRVLLVVLSQVYLFISFIIYYQKNNPLWKFIKIESSKSKRKKASEMSGKLMIISGLFSLYIPLRMFVGSFEIFMVIYVLILIMPLFFSYLFYKYIVSEDYNLYN